jgi:hypothetical protein
MSEAGGLHPRGEGARWRCASNRPCAVRRPRRRPCPFHDAPSVVPPLDVANRTQEPAAARSESWKGPHGTGWRIPRAS